MSKNYIIGFLVSIIICVSAAPKVEAKRKPIVVPTKDSYVLVHGAHLWPVHGYYSIHPAIMPKIVESIIYLPAWNGVFWAYEYIVVPKY